VAYIFCTDKRLHITSWGDELAELTGRSTRAVLGKEYFAVLPRIFSDDKDALSLVLEKNKPLTLKRYAYLCMLDRMSADIRVEPRRTEGRVEGVMVTLSDLSPCSVDQSFRNSQRFIDIGKAASTLAHGVRNPLNAIKGAIVYLSEKYTNDPAFVEFAEIMKDEILRLDNFISRFLSTSFSDAGFVSTDINSLLERMKVFTSFQTHASRIKSVYELGDIPPIVVNAFQIEQAILNVMNNAIDAMRSGGELFVKTRTETLTGEGFVVIEISDTGSKLAKKAMDAPSLPSDSNSGGKGKGFGLFITREILQYHKGHLEIKSRKDKGTSVRFYLPLRIQNS
jgi:two-component system nitrogen regulation sensor histidine kinase GlnL